MTIAKRLIIPLVVPLLAFVGLGVFNWIQVTNVENRSRFVSEMQIPSLAMLGNITRNFVDLRVAVRSHLPGDQRNKPRLGRTGVCPGCGGNHPAVESIR